MFATSVVCSSYPSFNTIINLFMSHSTCYEPFTLLLLSNELNFLRSTKVLIMAFTSDRGLYRHTNGGTFDRLNMAHYPVSSDNCRRLLKTGICWNIVDRTEIEPGKPGSPP